MSKTFSKRIKKKVSPLPPSKKKPWIKKQLFSKFLNTLAMLHTVLFCMLLTLPEISAATVKNATPEKLHQIMLDILLNCSYPKCRLGCRF